MYEILWHGFQGDSSSHFPFKEREQNFFQEISVNRQESFPEHSYHGIEKYLLIETVH